VNGEDVWCYGVIEYFAAHEFSDSETHYLAYVHCYKDVEHQMDEMSGIVSITCGELGRHDWISIDSIDCLVGSFETHNTRYIVDRFSFVLRDEMGFGL
jgi:hypothetical protein